MMDKKERIWNWFYSIGTIFFGNLFYLSILVNAHYIIVLPKNITETTLLSVILLMPVFFILIAINRLAYMIDYVTNRKEEER